MAYIKQYLSVDSGSSATVTCPTFDNAVNDLIIFIPFADGTTTGTWSITTGTGWTERATSDVQGGGVSKAVYHKIAAASPETPPIATQSIGAAAAGGLVFVIGDADTTTPIDAYSQVTHAAGVSHQMAALTTTVNNCLLLWVNINDAPSNRQPVAQEGTMLLESPLMPNDNVTVMWTFQPTSGAAVRPTVEIGAADDGQGFGIALRSSGTPVIPAYGVYASPPANIIHPMRGVYTGYVYGGSLFDPTGVVTAIGGITATYEVLALSSAGGILPIFDAITAQSPSAGSASQYWIGGWAITSTNLSSSKIVIHIGASGTTNPLGLKSLADGGAIFGLRDTSNRYRIFRVAAYDSKPLFKNQHAVVIDPADSDYQFVADIGGTCDLTAINGIIFGGYKRTAATNFMRITACSFHKVNTVTLTGGHSTVPMVWQTAIDATASSELLTITNQMTSSSRQYLSLQSIQIGNGGALYFADPYTNLEFMQHFSIANKTLQRQVDVGSLTLTLYGVSGNTIDMSNVVCSSEDDWNYTIHASSTTACTWIADNHVIINADVTLQNVYTAMSGITFSGCGQITHNSADLSGGCTIDSCKDTNSIVFNGATEAALQTLIDKVANCTFSNNNVAIRVEYTGTGNITLNFSGITWTSNTTDIHYNSTNASALTANMQSGSNATTSAISGAATSVTISNDVTFTVNISVTGAELTILATGSTATEYHVETAGTSEAFTFTAPLGNNVDIQVFKPGYKPYWEANRDLGSANSSITVTLEVDLAY